MGWKYFNDEEEEKLLKEALGEKPAYTNSYADSITALEKEMERRPDFSYDPDSDPLYRQYETQYRREGSRAVDDTLAAAASAAGGMNSYAVTAAQQAGDYYNAQLMDRIPELAELAYEMYLRDENADAERLAQLRAQETEEYDRYRDALNDWYAELDAAYRQYRDGVEDSRWQQELDYQKQQDAAEAERWQQQMDYQKQQDTEDNRYRQDAFEYGKTQDAIDNQYRQDAFEYGKTQDAIDNQYRQDVFDYEKAQDAAVNAPYAGTDYYQQAIDAAMRGDRDGAMAALEKRAAKMADPAYGGNGGGTSMAEAYAYVESLLAGTANAEKAAQQYLRENGYTEAEVNGMLSEAAWQERRRSYLRNGSGPAEVTDYDTYEDYLAAYIRYLSEQ